MADDAEAWKNKNVNFRVAKEPEEVLDRELDHHPRQE